MLSIINKKKHSINYRPDIAHFNIITKLAIEHCYKFQNIHKAKYENATLK